MAMVGALLGTLVGVLPGLGPATTLALLLPLVVNLPPASTLIVMAGVYYGAMYGGSTTSVLVNIPGEVSSVPTALEGYPMTLQGRPGPALAMSAIASFIGGTLATLMLTFVSPALANMALSFGPPEYFALAFFSLASASGLSGGSPLKGLIMVFVGLVMATIGWDPLTSVPRLTFSKEFLAGLDAVPVVIGLFGLSEAVLMIGETMEKYSTRIGPLMPSRDEFRRGMGASIRGSIIGSLLGVVPGVIVAVTSFLSYDVEKKVSKHPERFGKGMIEGIAGPEAANNATAVAGMIPLMSLGIPTSPALAIMLAALLVYGIQPGPLLFYKYATTAWAVIASIYIGNLACLILNLPLVGMWAKIAQIPRSLMAPIILGISVVGAYSTRNLMLDVWVAVFFGLVGYVMKKRDWPQAPLVLGFILGPFLEQSLRRTLSVAGGGLYLVLQRPISASLFIAGCLALALSLWMELSRRRASP
ncbi:MAG: tripartite tricarboxylate transporter permease [Firmicutes bacterium]|nr:tripartite tricarboxylate transporter permease [Bacillota bacterium]